MKANQVGKQVKLEEPQETKCVICGKTMIAPWGRVNGGGVCGISCQKIYDENTRVLKKE